MAGDAKLADHGRALAEAIDQAVADWVVRCVDGRIRDYTGGPASPEVLAAARAAGEQARVEVGAAVQALLALDVDEQRANPLAILRDAVRHPTQVLRDAGVPPIVRDEFEERAFPDDVYGLSPASFADVDPSLHEPGIVWGAAKAYVHLQRHKPRDREA